MHFLRRYTEGSPVFVIQLKSLKFYFFYFPKNL
jgi:hypothetical protein